MSLLVVFRSRFLVGVPTGDRPRKYRGRRAHNDVWASPDAPGPDRRETGNGLTKPRGKRSGDTAHLHLAGVVVRTVRIVRRSSSKTERASSRLRVHF